jgi:hypothetical protein
MTYLQAIGRAIAQAGSYRLRARVRSCGIRGEQSATGAAFLRVLRFSLQILSTGYSTFINYRSRLVQ